MKKKYLALISVVIALAVALSLVFIYMVYVNTPANAFEQKLKGLPNVTFISATKAQLNSELEGSGQSQFIKVSGTEFISSVQTAERDGYTSFITRIGNTFYFLAEKQTYVYCTP